MTVRISLAALAFATSAAAAAVQERTVKVSGAWLQVPVCNRTERCKVNVWDGKENVFSFCVNAGTNAPDWFFPIHVSRHVGKNLRFSFVPDKDADLHVPFERFRFTDGPEYGPGLYHEEQRPQFHFTPIVGWNNDPNGLSYCRGYWHLFYQGAPCARDHRQNFWGHAVSRDLVHWKEIDPAIWPDNDEFAASGSGVVDETGSAGFGAGAHVLIYTRMPWWGGKDNAFAQSLAYSTDGIHYAKYAGNPVLPEYSFGNRDPKVFWHAPSRKWVMFLYVGNYEGDWHAFNIYNSDDLKNWTLTSTLKGSRMHSREDGDPRNGTVLHECPDCCELQVEGEPAQTRWVTWGAWGEYLIGDFDGRTFSVREGPVTPNWRAMGYYAAQTFSGNPSGRVVWMPWYNLTTRSDMKFNQGMGLPCELGLKRTAAGLRMTFKPVRELESLRDGTAVPFPRFDGELVEAVVKAKAGKTGELRLVLRGATVVWHAETGMLTFECGDLGRQTVWKPEGGDLSLRIYIDRLGAEIYSADGLNVMPVPAFVPDRAQRRLSASASGDVRLESAEAYRLKGIWK